MGYGSHSDEKSGCVGVSGACPPCDLFVNNKNRVNVRSVSVTEGDGCRKTESGWWRKKIHKCVNRSSCRCCGRDLFCCVDIISTGMMEEALKESLSSLLETVSVLRGEG